MSTPGTAVVTGGASGFGLALAAELAARGMAVALLDIDGLRAEREAAALSAGHGVATLGLAMDVSDATSVSNAASAVSERLSGADLVVSNVGVQLFGSLERLTDEEWHWLLDVNVIGSARVVRAFLPLLRLSRRGRIAFTTSSSVLDVASRLGGYQVTKFAVWGLAETLRLELAGEGIAVSVIFPSGMTSRHLETSEAAQPDHLRRPIGADEDFAEMVASNPSMASMVTTPEAAAARVIDAVLDGRRYAITHGDLVHAVDARSRELRLAAEIARDPPGTVAE